jgi:hypothetical protein
VGTDLEQRRQAVAAALREIMAEPLPATTAPVSIDVPVFLDEPAVAAEPAAELAPEPEPVSAVEPEGIDLRDQPDLAAAEAEFDAWDDDEPAVSDTHAVPPLEKVGSMSKVASLALFGHD